MSIDKTENCTQLEVATSWLYRLSKAAADEDVHAFCDLMLPGGWMRGEANTRSVSHDD